MPLNCLLSTSVDRDVQPCVPVMWSIWLDDCEPSHWRLSWLRPWDVAQPTSIRGHRVTIFILVLISSNSKLKMVDIIWILYVLGPWPDNATLYFPLRCSIKTCEACLISSKNTRGLSPFRCLELTASDIDFPWARNWKMRVCLFAATIGQVPQTIYSSSLSCGLQRGENQLALLLLIWEPSSLAISSYKGARPSLIKYAKLDAPMVL